MNWVLSRNQVIRKDGVRSPESVHWGFRSLVKRLPSQLMLGMEVPMCWLAYYIVEKLVRSYLLHLALYYALFKVLRGSWRTEPPSELVFNSLPTETWNLATSNIKTFLGLDSPGSRERNQSNWLVISCVSSITWKGGDFSIIEAIEWSYVREAGISRRHERHCRHKRSPILA